MLGFAERRHGYDCPEDGWAEQDAQEVWDLVRQLVKEALRLAAPAPPIEAVAVSVQGDAIIPIDAAGNPLHAAILGMDTRSFGEAADLAERFGKGPLYSTTGMPCKPMTAITKILWLERNRPELRAKLWKYVHYEEFLLMKLAGVPALNFTMASRTMAFDPVRKDWIPAILEFVGITSAELGNLTPSGMPVGIIRRAIADEWGIARSALLVSGGHNTCLAAVGSGVVDPGLGCYFMGTAEVIGTCFDSPRISPAMLACNYPCYCHAVDGHYFTSTLNHGGGISLEWFHGKLMERGENEDASFEALLNEIRPWPSPVLFLPHLTGSGTPASDHTSRAAFIGMSLKTGRHDLLQAVADAQAFEARLNLETLSDLGITVSQLRAVEWGARSNRLLELKATVLDRPIHIPRQPEAALLGAAMLAQTATGRFRNLSEASNECALIARTVEPIQVARQAYDDAFERYRHLYPALKSFYQNWRVEAHAPVLV